MLTRTVTQVQKRLASTSSVLSASTATVARVTSKSSSASAGSPSKNGAQAGMRTSSVAKTSENTGQMVTPYSAKFFTENGRVYSRDRRYSSPWKPSYAAC